MIFDLDGVLADSEQLWDRIRKQVVAETGGDWKDGASEAMLGMSTPEWSRYLVDELGVPLTPQQVAERVIDQMAKLYAEQPPLLPGGVQAARAIAARYPTAIASSAPPRIIQAFLEVTDLLDAVRYTVSSEQVGAGKPAPDVYLDAAEGLGIDPRHGVAVEDSSNGIKAAVAAGTTVFAVPNPHFPPPQEVLRTAYRVLDDIGQLPAAIAELDR